MSERANIGDSSVYNGLFTNPNEIIAIDFLSTINFSLVQSKMKSRTYHNLKGDSYIIEEIIKQIIKFRDDRDWGKFHNPKDLAISLSIEASELLENFQWKDNGSALQNKNKIKDELADVLIYSLLLSHELDLDFKQIIIDKVKINSEKYPIAKAFGTNKKYTEL